MSLLMSGTQPLPVAPSRSARKNSHPERDCSLLPGRLISSYLYSTPVEIPVLSRVWGSLDHLHKNLEKGGGTNPRWKRVVLHLHFPVRPDGEREKTLDQISTRSTQYADYGPRASNKRDGTSNFHETVVVNGKPVKWQMYEVSAQGVRCKRPKHLMSLIANLDSTRHSFVSKSVERFTEGTELMGAAEVQLQSDLIR